MSGPHDVLMRRTLELARKGWGRTHPNPMVGALIVEGGEVVAEGFHAQDGGPHAERVALGALGRKPRPGATLYVTLEPCSTVGRTGACTAAIQEAGLTRVVVGALDPNPVHAGQGLAILRDQGVEVIDGVRTRECTDLNVIFNHWITRSTPLFAGKAAITMDGRTACRSGDSKWITGEAARADVHRWRRLFPAIAAGAGTLASDNPRLTARIAGEAEWSPVRFIFDGLLRSVVEEHMPRVYTDEFREKTIVVTTRHGGEGYVRKLKDRGVQVWVCDSSTQRVSLEEFRRRCVAAKITGVLFEGGPRLMSQAIQEKALDYFFAYRSPLILADDRAKTMLGGFRAETLAQAIRLGEVRNQVFGDDVLTWGRIVYPPKLQVDEASFSVG